MKYKKILGIIAGFFYASSAMAGVFELGASFSWNQSGYSDGSYTWTRAYSGSLGYYFTADSELEFVYSNSANKTFVPTVQDTMYYDQNYSLNFIYYFMDEASAFRPFGRIGVGELNRSASGTYEGGAVPGELDQLTVILGTGFKFKLAQKLSLKLEAVTYLTGGSISTWNQNCTFDIGLAVYF